MGVFSLLGYPAKSVVSKQKSFPWDFCCATRKATKLFCMSLWPFISSYDWKNAEHCGRSSVWSSHSCPKWDSRGHNHSGYIGELVEVRTFELSPFSLKQSRFSSVRRESKSENQKDFLSVCTAWRGVPKEMAVLFRFTCQIFCFSIRFPPIPSHCIPIFQF